MCRNAQTGFVGCPIKKVRFAEPSPREHTPRQSSPQPTKQALPQSLRIRGNVRLGEVEVQGGVQFFAIDVFPDNGEAPWRVMRRYNQFRILAEAFGFVNVPAHFPERSWSGCRIAELERRRQGLETWLTQAIITSTQHQSWIPVLRAFLETSSFRVPKVNSQPPDVAPDAIALRPAVTPQKSGDAQDSTGTGAAADELLNAVVPRWQSLCESVEIKNLMPQIREVYRSAVAQSQVFEMLD